MSELTTAGSFEVDRGDLGWGIFARREFHRGDYIFTFTGPLIDFDGTVAKGERESDPLQIGENLYIDLEEPGRSINHSCAPNSGVIENRILIAIRSIQPGEEISLDYSTTMGDGHWTMICACGNASCRGVIRDFEYLDQELRQSYLELNVVQGYLRHRLGEQLQADRHGRGEMASKDFRR